MEGDGWTPALSPWGQTSDRRRGPALALLLNGERSSVSIPRMLNQIGVLVASSRVVYESDLISGTGVS
ncbi:hypothetical protein MTY66_48890 [Mycolicibacterium sp. TY66]|nr:hypothetical protein MTY66_48890 [Mycolicibacterium sp. TY66]BCJ79093.1 hypothetical protein MTY81_04660 [Mycolicibacterium sp. TY81]